MPASSRKPAAGRRTSTQRGAGPNSRAGKDAIALLQQDHQKIRRLLRQLGPSAGRGGEEILEEIETELKMHTQLEEEIFYPAFKEAMEGRKDEHLYYEAIEEHHLLNLVLPEIKATSEDSEEFAAKAKVLQDLLEHHAIEKEEGQMFPKARRVLDRGELRELGRQLQQRKQELMTAGARTRMRAA